MQGPCQHTRMSAWYMTNKDPVVWRRDCLTAYCGYYQIVKG